MRLLTLILACGIASAQYYPPPGSSNTGTGNAADPEAYTPAASVTLTCASATANTVTTFTPSAALAANMAITFARCTPGQVIMLTVNQAASGGPYTVSGLPTGAPQISTYPSAGTIYTFNAVTSSTVSFSGVVANAGATSLGAGANGISRTVTAAAAGVTVNLLAAKDASNPTLYQTAALGGCGSGIAAYSATSGNLFELYTVPGTVLTVVADGTITAGHLLTGGASTAGRVADTGQTARTAVPIGTCLVGVALQSQTVGNTLLIAYDGTEAYGAGAASSVAWNAITNPTGNLSLTMGSDLSVFNYQSLATTTISAFTFANTTASTSGATVQITPALEFDGHAWNTTSVRADNFTQMRNYCLPVSGASPSLVCKWDFAIDTGTPSWTTEMSVTSAGVLTLPGGTEAAPSLSFGLGTGFYSSSPGSGITQIVGGGAVVEVFSVTNNRLGSGNVFGWSSAIDPLGALNDTGVSRISAGVMGVGTGAAGSVSGTVEAANLISTAAAATVMANQIAYGSTVASSTNCGTIGTGCIVINIAGTTRYITYY